MAKPQNPPGDAEVKSHYFEVVMNSYSGNGSVLNQEVVLVREYAETGAILTAKQMAFSKEAVVPMAKAVVDAMDKMSAPLQEEGYRQIQEAFEKFGKQ